MQERVIRFASFSRAKLHFPLLSLFPFLFFPLSPLRDASTGPQSVPIVQRQLPRKPIVLDE